MRLLTRREASIGGVRSALDGAELFHFAGHGVFRGREGWESHLALADDTRLFAADVLALAVPPRTVILSACDAARTEGAATSAEELGLAQAFIAAGTSFVVAPVRPVADDVTSQLMIALHEGLARGLDVREALRAAQLDLARRTPQADWAAFRVLSAGN